MKKNKFYSIHSQLSLPFLESDKIVLETLFSTLENELILKKNSDQKFIDLGSGTGQVVIYCALNYNIYSKGVEISPYLIEEAKEQIQKLRNEKKYEEKRFKQIDIEYGDLFEQNLSEFDFIYIFSLPTMQKYLNHVFKTARKDAIFISYKYPLEEFKYLKKAKKIEVNCKHKKISIYFYKKL